MIATTIVLAAFAMLEVDLPSAAAHWPLAGQYHDVAGSRLSTSNRGVEFSKEPAEHQGPSWAQFDGRSSRLIIADSPALRFGRADFTISAWVNVPVDASDLPGDIACKYDPKLRRGFTLSMISRSGTPHSQSNDRGIHFGIDDGKMEPRWVDRGRPGKAVYVHALAVYDGSLWAGTCESGQDEAGHVYRFDGNAGWIDCGSPAPCNSVTSLATWKGRLFAGVARYRLAGSALPESLNPHVGGGVFRYEGGKSWTNCGRLPASEAVACLAAYRSDLYASSLYRPAGFFRFDGKQIWQPLAVPAGKRVEALCVYNGQMFAGSYDGGDVYRFDGKRWSACGTVGANTQTYGFAVHWGDLFVGAWPSGRVYRYRADGDWSDCGRLGDELEVMGMAVHNGKLYAGTLPLAQVHRYDGGKTWTNTGQVDRTVGVKYRRAWTMAEYRGQLFCGTLPSGRVMSMAAGDNVAVDRPLPAGWHHIAAVRAGKQLRIYVDAVLAAESSGGSVLPVDVDNEEPLYVGYGPNDGFNGQMRDVRIDRRALSPEQISEWVRATR